MSKLDLMMKLCSDKNYITFQHINMHFEITSIFFYPFSVEKYEIARIRLIVDLICT